MDSRAHRRRLSFAIGLLLLLAPFSLSGQIRFSRLDHTNGLPQINVVSIYQDETGAMWFGTTGGLCRYNGSSTQVFRSSPEYPGLTKNSILSITGNRNGAIYIRTEYDLIRYDIAREQFRVLSSGVTGMYYGKEKLWFSVDDKIYSWSEESDEISFHFTTKDVGASRLAMWVATDGKIWLGCDGLSVIDSKGKSRKVLDGVGVFSIFIDSEGLVWAGTFRHGLYVLDANGSVKHHFVNLPDTNSIPNDFVRAINEDDRGTIWIGTAFGLGTFDKASGRWSRHIPDDTQPGSLSDYSVFSIYRDMQNAIWIGTYYGGVNYFNPRRDIFRYYSASSEISDRLSFPFVGNMTQDTEGNLWICTEGGGLNRLDLRTRKFTRYFYDEYLTERTSEYHLKSIHHDPATGKLYMGVYGVGLWIFDTKTLKGKLVRGSSLWTARNIQLWRGQMIVQFGWGLYRLDAQTDKISLFSEDEKLSALLNKDFAYEFFIDSRDMVWLSTPAGLKRIDLNTKEEKSYVDDGDSSRSPGKSEVMSFIETRGGELFFCTLGSGLFRYNPADDDFENYTENNRTQISDFGYHITETADGNLLILHNDAFSIFDPRTCKTIYRSTENFPISGFFEGNSSYATTDGEIFIGGVNGLASVDWSLLKDASSEPADYKLYFDRLYVDGKAVVPNDETGILSAILPLTDKLKLSHQHNNFSIELATSDYSERNASKGRYQYRLEGLDETWNTASSEMISYTNITPGKYRLVVREENSVRNGESKTIALDITVLPPFYATVFAQIVYALLTAALIVGILFFFMWRYRMRTSLEMEKKEKEMKLGFFTGISHEFRTPLTLILAQIENILSSHNLPPALKKDISKVHNNASHMRDLISELLDFQKTEQGHYKLKIEQVDMVPYIDEIYSSFTEYADKHGIRYVYESPQSAVEAYIDKAQLRKAIHNLLSNAFKYTRDGGEITVRLREDECIRIEVEDNGIGISSESLSKIFERFYQVEYNTSGFSLGTGIGLALTKEIVENHKGSVSVKSSLNEGSLFEIKLQTGSSHFDSEKLAHITVAPIAQETGSGGTPEPAAPGVTDQIYSILIVEDNEQLLALLAEVFSDVGTVFTAVNGKQGLKMAEEHIPDVILTDVMMPEMSGTEMCRIIKSDVKLSHIPVVMLTSLDSADDTVEGFIFGADDYVAKPFNVRVLKARVGSIVRGRRLFFRSVTRSRELAGVEVRSEHDAAFMERATAIIRANFDNPEFDMNMLAAQMGMGRTSLYTSLKDISGMTPNEFTLVIKLRESTELLRDHTHLNISEIADKLGFSSTKYFSKCFKTFYGVTPIQWRKENS